MVYTCFGNEAMKKNNGYTYGWIVEKIILKYKLRLKDQHGSLWWIVLETIQSMFLVNRQ